MAELFNADTKILQRMAPHLQRALVIDPQPAATRLLGDLLRSITPCQIYSAQTVAQGVQLARAMDPQIVFVEYHGPDLDGLAFCRALRRSDLNCRQAPIIMVTSEATAGAIIGARDAGVHEFLRKPYTMKDLSRRLEAVTLKPRDWVEAVHYIGPDRRRFNSGDYAGPRKRRSDAKATPDQTRILQALKIVRSAAQALDSDWMQARRSLLAQAVDLQKVAVKAGAMSLMEAAANLQRRLTPEERPARDALMADIAQLLTFMPKEDEARAA